jgi:hypothetical protein
MARIKIYPNNILVDILFMILAFVMSAIYMSWTNPNAIAPDRMYSIIFVIFFEK